MHWTRDSLAVCLALALLASLAPARAAQPSGSINEVIDCALRSLPPSVRGRFTLDWRNAKGEQRVIEGNYWGEQPSEGARKVIVASSGGEPSARAAYLFSEGDLVGEAWVWKPDQPAARRVHAHGPESEMFGTDVNFEDFARFARFLFPGQLRRLDDAEIGGRAVYVVETTPSPDSGSEYQRIVSSLDKEWCVILRREGYEIGFERGEQPRKILRADPADVKIEGEFARVTRATLADQRDGTETRISLEDLGLGAESSEDFFTPENLPKTAK